MPMDNQITIKKENILNVYNQATDEQKELLENVFGKDMFQPQNIKERVKTFVDAVVMLGNDNKTVLDYYAVANIGCSPDTIAFAKLKVIAEALNEGWKPKFDRKEYRYYTWFYIYSKDEYDDLSEEKKAACRVINVDNSRGYAHVSPTYAHAYSALSSKRCGNNSKLAFKTRELAEYCGKQFMDIWMDFLFDNSNNKSEITEFCASSNNDNQLPETRISTSSDNKCTDEGASSLWHDVSEAPKDNSKIKIKMQFDVSDYCMGIMDFEVHYFDNFGWDDMVDEYSIKKWAYVDDLLLNDILSLKGGKK